MKSIIFVSLLSLISNMAFSNVINCNWEGGGQLIVEEATSKSIHIFNGKLQIYSNTVTRNPNNNNIWIHAHHAEHLHLTLDFKGSDGKTPIAYPYSFTADLADTDEFLGKGGCFSDEYPIF